MGHLEAQQGLAAFLAQLGDLVKVAGCNIGLGADPAAAHGMDVGIGNELAHVLQVHAAGGDEFHAAEGTGQGLDGAQAAIDIGGEELQHLQSVLQGHHDLGGGDTAGADGNAVVAAPGHHFLIIAGGDDELGAAFHSQLALLQIHHGAGAHQHFGDLSGHGSDGVGSGSGAEGDLHHVNAAGHHGLGSGDGVLGIFQHHNGNNTGAGHSFQYIHGFFLLCYYVCHLSLPGK